MTATTDKYDAVLESITTGGIATIPVIPDKGREGVKAAPEEAEEGTLDEGICPHCKRPMGESEE